MGVIQMELNVETRRERVSHCYQPFSAVTPRKKCYSTNCACKIYNTLSDLEPGNNHTLSKVGITVPTVIYKQIANYTYQMKSKQKHLG